MEATVRILNQSGLITRQYPDKKTGELKEIVYPVWTEKGQKMIKEMISDKGRG